jgi:hypothetical protein
MNIFFYSKKDGQRLIFNDALRAVFWEGYSWDKYCTLDGIFLVGGERGFGGGMVGG